jgi:hypothetical protein
MSIESWRSIKNYEDFYEVSDFGNVRSKTKVEVNSIGVSVTYIGKLLSPFLEGRGYKRVRLYKNTKGLDFSIHRLVAQSFLDNPNLLPIVNHLDEIKTNNHKSNLDDCKHQIKIVTTGLRLQQEVQNEQKEQA